MRRIAMIALMGLAFPTAPCGAEWRIEAQFLESRSGQKPDSPSRGFGPTIPKGYKTKGTVVVTAKPGEPFSAEATLGGTTFALSGVVRQQSDGKITLEVEVARQRIRGRARGAQRISSSLCFSAAEQAGAARLGQCFFIGGLHESAVRNGKEHRVTRGHAFTLKKQE